MNATVFTTMMKGRFRYKTLYHFTDKSNWASIAANGILSKQQLEALGIEPDHAGGDDESRKSDKLNGLYDFVSLSFTPQSPMAYTCRTDGRQPNQIMISVCPSVLTIDTTLICPEMANTSGAAFHAANDFVGELDYEVWLADHGKPFHEIKDRVDKMKKVEVLVKTSVQPQKILDHWKIG